jgi:hypothetical protein
MLLFRYPHEQSQQISLAEVLQPHGPIDANAADPAAVLGLDGKGVRAESAPERSRGVSQATYRLPKRSANGRDSWVWWSMARVSLDPRRPSLVRNQRSEPGRCRPTLSAPPLGPVPSPPGSRPIRATPPLQADDEVRRRPKPLPRFGRSEEDDGTAVSFGVSLEEIAHLLVGVPIVGVVHLRAFSEESVRLVEEEDRPLLLRAREQRREVLLRLADVLRHHPGEVELEESAPTRAGEKLRSKRLAGAVGAVEPRGEPARDLDMDPGPFGPENPVNPLA